MTFAAKITFHSQNTLNMSKFFFFSAIFALFFGSSPNSLMAQRNLEHSSQQALTETCSAPAPGNFQISEVGDDHLNLVWTPAWPGALHTLVILKREAYSNTWEPLDTIHNLGGNSFYFLNTNLTRSYQFVIRTNCVDGGPSSLSNKIEHIGLILDLTIAGRTPINPTQKPICEPVYYKQFNWVGLEIRTNGLGGLDQPVNYFEFNTGLYDIYTIPVLKRVIYGPDIVAGSADLTFPTNTNQHVFIGGDLTYPFSIFKVLSDGSKINIGTLALTFSGDSTFKICVLDWTNIKYTPRVVVANSSNGLIDNYISDRGFWAKEPTANTCLKAQNPFKESLNIYINDIELNNFFNLQLINSTGETVRTIEAINTGDLINMDTQTLPKGIYYLKYSSKGLSQYLKLVKFD